MLLIESFFEDFQEMTGKSLPMASNDAISAYFPNYLGEAGVGRVKASSSSSSSSSSVVRRKSYGNKLDCRPLLVGRRLMHHLCPSLIELRRVLTRSARRNGQSTDRTRKERKAANQSEQYRAGRDAHGSPAPPSSEPRINMTLSSHSLASSFFHQHPELQEMTRNAVELTVEKAVRIALRSVVQSAASTVINSNSSLRRNLLGAESNDMRRLHRAILESARDDVTLAAVSYCETFLPETMLLMAPSECVKMMAGEAGGLCAQENPSGGALLTSIDIGIGLAENHVRALLPARLHADVQQAMRTCLSKARKEQRSKKKDKAYTQQLVENISILENMLVKHDMSAMAHERVGVIIRRSLSDTCTMIRTGNAADLSRLPFEEEGYEKLTMFASSKFGLLIFAASSQAPWSRSRQPWFARTVALHWMMRVYMTAFHSG